MHSFLRAIGFSHVTDRQASDTLLEDVCSACDVRNAVRLENGSAFVEYVKEFAPGIGIIVCGEMDGNGFHRDYYFPYYKTETVSSCADLVIEKHAGKDSFAGVCEDVRMGTTLIFYVMNAAQYQRESMSSRMENGNISVTLTGLSTEGKILLPVFKNPDQDLLDMEAASSRSRLIMEARNGDESAIESLTLEDIDTYNMISRRIMNEDVFSIVDTFFMPFGMECDRYQLMGEIQSYKKVKNIRTKEYVYQMKLLCNNMLIDVCINEADLLGDPEEGRRFKGEVWLQGHINFTD
ncbi:MAG: DUF3881 family protein [Eubacteriales bacterium]|nr:DUF3881 family protein [Eubacteriales bacterium]